MNPPSPGMIAYDYLRDEIKREDTLTHGRMMVGFTFQGFLLTAMALLVATPWQNAVSLNAIFVNDLNAFRVAALGGIGVIGFLVAVGTTMGVFAASISLGNVRKSWEADCGKLELVPSLPQAYGQNWAFTLGGWFAPVTCLWFVVLWAAYLTIYAIHLFDHYGIALV